VVNDLKRRPMGKTARPISLLGKKMSPRITGRRDALKPFSGGEGGELHGKRYLLRKEAFSKERSLYIGGITIEEAAPEGPDVSPVRKKHQIEEKKCLPPMSKMVAYGATGEGYA